MFVQSCNMDGSAEAVVLGIKVCTTVCVCVCVCVCVGVCVCVWGVGGGGGWVGRVGG